MNTLGLHTPICTDDEGKMFSKYVLKKRQGDKDGKNTLDLSDDAAHVRMSVRPVWDSEVGRDVIWNSSKGDFVFFTENNKPEEYIIHNPDFPTSSVSNSYYENKIGEARANNMNDIIEQGIKWNYNGAILLKSTTRTFFEDPMHGIVTQQYIPIIYDQEKYPSSKSSKKISK